MASAKILLAAAAAVAACAPLATPPPSPAPRGALALHGEAGVPARIGAAFHTEVARRFTGDTGMEAAAGDLTANGFICSSKGAYPQVKIGEVVAVCELPKPHGLCSDMWTVDLRLRQVTRALDFHRVAPEGRFARTCVSGASPDG